MKLTIKELDKAAKENGMTRGKGTYNGGAYWKNANGTICPRWMLEELALGQ